MVVPPAPVRVSSQRPLVPSVACHCRDKGDNEMMLGAVHRSPVTCLTAEENPGKPQQGNLLMKGYATSHRLKWGLLSLNEVGRITQHWRKEKTRGKETKLLQARTISRPH